MSDWESRRPAKGPLPGTAFLPASGAELSATALLPPPSRPATVSARRRRRRRRSGRVGGRMRCRRAQGLSALSSRSPPPLLATLNGELVAGQCLGLDRQRELGRRAAPFPPLRLRRTGRRSAMLHNPLPFSFASLRRGQRQRVHGAPVTIGSGDTGPVPLAHSLQTAAPARPAGCSAPLEGSRSPPRARATTGPHALTDGADLSPRVKGV